MEAKLFPDNCVVDPLHWADVFFLHRCSLFCCCSDSQNDIEAATEFTETDPPSYDGVIEKEEKTCPSYDQAVKID